MTIFAYLTNAYWRVMVIVALIIKFRAIFKFSRLNFEKKKKFEDVIENSN